jgi:hypothetical protein
METGDKPGFFASSWMTLVLIGVLVLLVVIFIVIQSTGGFTNFFDKFKKKEDPKPTIKPGRPVMDQQFHNPGERPRLELADNGFITLTGTELS